MRIFFSPLASLAKLLKIINTKKRKWIVGRTGYISLFRGIQLILNISIMTEAFFAKYSEWLYSEIHQVLFCGSLFLLVVF